MLLSSLRVHKRSRRRLPTAELLERTGARSITLSCLVRRSLGRLTAAILSFALVMPTIARPVERGPVPRWRVSMLTGTWFLGRFGGRKGYWGHILMEASR